MLNKKDAIQREILKNGPVVSLMQNYRQFMLFEKGVFSFENISHHGAYQAVKVIGWGEEEVDDEMKSYWLVESQWGSSWAVSGIAKVEMDHDDCLQSKFAIAITPAGKRKGDAQDESA